MSATEKRMTCNMKLKHRVGRVVRRSGKPMNQTPEASGKPSMGLKPPSTAPWTQDAKKMAVYPPHLGLAVTNGPAYRRARCRQ